MSPKRVLLVEDEATVAFLMKESLTDLGLDYHIETAASGEEALAKIETGRWDVVVTDLRMPGITGLELIRQLKDKSPDTRTVLMTAYGSEQVQQAAQRLNVYNYLTKPFPLIELRRVIQDAFTLKQACAGDEPPPAPEPEPALPLKITLGGNGSVGKTTLIRRLCTGKFQAARVMTLGVDFHLYDIAHHNRTRRLVVWDVSGQDQFAFTRRAFYRGSRAVGLVYATNDRASFAQLLKWHDEVRAILPRVPLVIAANKTDLARDVPMDEGRALAAAWGAPFFETSCLTGDGVSEFFNAMADAAHKHASR
ncbi:MAG: response regulator [Chloroflexi bacterium]|nr:response regulator [Chloroflexota bacterium]